jgi:hypothetical protein
MARPGIPFATNFGLQADGIYQAGEDDVVLCRHTENVPNRDKGSLDYNRYLLVPPFDPDFDVPGIAFTSGLLGASGQTQDDTVYPQPFAFGTSAKTLSLGGWGTEWTFWFRLMNQDSAASVDVTVDYHGNEDTAYRKILNAWTLAAGATSAEYGPFTAVAGPCLITFPSSPAFTQVFQIRFDASADNRAAAQVRLKRGNEDNQYLLLQDVLGL